MLLRSLNLKAAGGSHSSRVRRLTRIAAVVMVGLIALLALFHFVAFPLFLKVMIGSQKPPAATVSAQASESRLWQSTVVNVATLVAVQGVDLTAEIDGVVREVAFNSGENVAAGALLVRLDDEISTAQLRQRQADDENARREFDRIEKLTKRGNASQSALDAARARRDQASAAVQQAQAQVDQKLIKAPFAGRTGVRRVNVGEFVKSGTVIVTLQTLSPLFVNFDLPEQALSRMAVGQAVEITTDNFPGARFAGKLTSFDPRIDPQSRTFLAQATLQNEDGKLAPGMFARASVSLGAPVARVSVPETAITYSLYGDSVFVVGASEEGKPAPVEQRRVQLGESRDGWIAVLSGLKEGEKVVTAGQLKLFPGATVTVDNSVALSPAAQSSKY